LTQSLIELDYYLEDEQEARKARVSSTHDCIGVVKINIGVEHSQTVAASELKG